MGKPYRLEGDGVRSPGIVRLPDGRFAPAPIDPPDVAVARAEGGKPIKESADENRAAQGDAPLVFGPLPPDPDGGGKPHRLR